MKNTLFEKISRIEAPVDEVFKWHARLGAIERYSPPWDPIKVIRRKGGIEKGAEVVIRMKAGPVPYLWHARHTDYEENRLFRDKQLKGPFSKWIHTHEFEPDGNNACYVRDVVEYKLLPHPFRKSISYRLVESKLAPIFEFRHRTLRQDMRAQLGYENRRPLNILISGASGLIGSNLIPFLTTAGHKVQRLVRYKPTNPNEIFWDPASFKIDSARLHDIDAVIHLAGDNIGDGKWTERKKDLIMSSRLMGTRLLAEAISKMKDPPAVFLSASAVGYYGHYAEKELTEKDKPGNDFISDVCRKWEEAATIAESSGIRTVRLRIGVVLDPRGGALQILRLLFKLGIKVGIAPGSQYLSWIGLNDTIDAIYHAIQTPEIEGPLNLVSPNPATSDDVSNHLAVLTGRKYFYNVPKSAIRLALGQKGEEVLLSDLKVLPEKLVNSNFDFRYDKLPQLLNHVLGKEKEGQR